MSGDEPNGYSNGITSADLRSVYKKLDAMDKRSEDRWTVVSEKFAEAKSDRRWFKWFIGVAVTIVGGGMLMLASWSDRLNTVEANQRAHIERGDEIIHVFRRDIDRNTVSIEALKEKSWRPARGEKEE